MLLDWITARVSLANFGADDLIQLRHTGDRIQRYNLATGEISWEAQAWDSIRSDSHNLSFRVGADALWVQGSPARIIGDGDAVFGSGAAAALDLPGCVSRMAAVLCAKLAILYPPVPCWEVSRIDVTGNVLLADLPTVRVALRLLRDCEGGRYRVSQQAGDTVYWNHKSRLRAGKAYAKGPHLRHLMGKRDYHGRSYTESDISIAEGLLRLELRLGSQLLRERISKPWHQITSAELTEYWHQYFSNMLGKIDISDMNSTERIKAVAATEGQAKAAVATWALIQAYGWEKAREMQSRPTWYRNLKVLHTAGLGDADLAAGRVVALRQPLLLAQQVNSWEELRRLVVQAA